MRLRTFLFVAALAACAKNQSSAEGVADGFVEAYFREMDQEKAKHFTAFGATTMLEQELQQVAHIRGEGYMPSDASGSVIVKRGTSSTREQRIRVPYTITMRHDDTETVREADVELSQIDGTWKVVRVGVKAVP